MFGVRVSDNYNSNNHRGNKMKDVKITVDKDKDCHDFMVQVSGKFTFQVDNFFDTTTVRFFLDADAVDRLGFQANSALQDAERAKADQDHKYEQARSE